jgi:TorA maturation chaperone TorD
MEETLGHVCQRADSYKLLSECYYLPDNALIQKVVHIAKTNQFFAELGDYIPSAVELESVKIDFTKLFIGPFKLLAPPYGSVYLEDNKFMGDSTIDVGKFYEEEDLEIVIKDAPDHIAMELECMYYLVAKQIQATNEGNLQDVLLYQQKQKAFLCSHLTRWLPEFTEKVQNSAQTVFYKKLAQLTEMFVQKDLGACTLFDTRHPYSIGGG